MLLLAMSTHRMLCCDVRANHRARESLFYALLGHIGPRGGLDLSSPSALIKVNYLVMRYLCFVSVRGDLQEGNGCASRCQSLSFRAQNRGFCALFSKRLGDDRSLYAITWPSCGCLLIPVAIFASCRNTRLPVRLI